MAAPSEVAHWHHSLSSVPGNTTALPQSDTAALHAAPQPGLGIRYCPSANTAELLPPWPPRDNACAETFHACLKREWPTERVLASQADAERAVFAYIDGFYNTTHLCQHCGPLSPNQHEAQYWATRMQKDAVERKKKKKETE